MLTHKFTKKSNIFGFSKLKKSKKIVFKMIFSAARPMCSQCRSNYSSSGYDPCWSNPDPPTQCPKPYESHCVSMDSQLQNKLSQDGYKRSIHRGCSYYDVGTSCSDVTYGDNIIRNCNKTCNATGCNLGKLQIYNSDERTKIRNSL